MWDDLGEYISKLCDENNKDIVKVVEIGVGKFHGISDYLKEKDNVELIMTDIDPNTEEVIKDDVFNAMEWQNINNNGKFSEKFAEAMLEEYNQLKKAKQENKVAECPQLDYLDLCIATCLDKHYPGFDNFIKYIMHNIDNLLEETWDYHYDPIKLKNTILANCIFYFALRNEAGYIEKLADVTQKGDILEIGTILNFFKEQKNDGIFDFLSKELENDYKNDLLIPSLLDSYFEYAKILNKKIPIILQEAKSRIDAKYSEQAKEILKGSKRFDEKFFKENNN